MKIYWRRKQYGRNEVVIGGTERRGNKEGKRKKEKKREKGREEGREGGKNTEDLSSMA